MSESDELTDLERADENCVLRFADGTAFTLSYIELRLVCPCAKCRPRQENEQRMIEFREEVMRLRMAKPEAELDGRYGIRFGGPTGCSSGLYSFTLMRHI